MRGGNWDMRGLSTEEKFRLKFAENRETGCWDWTASRFSDGYGEFRMDGKTRGAHRVSYELFIGPIPPGLTLDHLCRNRACVNPEHLEPVTHQENVLRGVSPAAFHARKTHCANGHPFNEENTTYLARRRKCRLCDRVYQRRYRERRRNRLSRLQENVKAAK